MSPKARIEQIDQGALPAASTATFEQATSPKANRAFIGVDPGTSGAIAVITKHSQEVHDYPADERALADLLWLIHLEHDVALCRIEYQHAMPQQGVTSTFKIGKNYGSWLTATAMLGWPVEVIRPKQWRTGLDYPGKKPGEKRGAHVKRLKEHSLTVARRFYPALADELKRKKDNGRAEALLIARSCPNI